MACININLSGHRSGCASPKRVRTKDFAYAIPGEYENAICETQAPLNTIYSYSVRICITQIERNIATFLEAHRRNQPLIIPPARFLARPEP